MALPDFFKRSQFISCLCYNFALLIKFREAEEVTILEQFEVRFGTLRPGLYDLRFEISDSFFEQFEYSEVEHGEGQCNVQLDRKENFLTFNFDIKMIVELICDRSLEKFQHPIELTKKLVVKFGQEETELGEDVQVIGWDQQEINLAHTIFEYVAISIPMKKVHPDYLTENEDEFGQIIYKSEKDASDDTIDPRWNALKKLN